MGINIPKTWTFRDSNVAEGFDEHVREQLPWYDMTSNAIAHIGRHFITDGGLVYDKTQTWGNPKWNKKRI